MTIIAGTNVSQAPYFTFDPINPKAYSGSGAQVLDLRSTIRTTTGSGGGTMTYTADQGYFTGNGTNQSFGFSPTITPVTGNGARSVFVWMRKNGQTNTCLFASGSPANNQAFNLVAYSARIGVMGYNYDYYPTTGLTEINPFDNQWHYVGCSYDGTTLTMYTDGRVDNTTSRGAYNTQGSNTYIGQSNHLGGNEQWWNANLGVLHYYTRAVTISEVQQNYESLRARYGR